MARQKKKDRTPDGWRSFANRMLWIAVREGKIKQLSKHEIKCVDCGEKATEWDHRDYRKPLDVEPVCRKCNNHRGPGLPWPEGYEGKPRRINVNGFKWSKLNGEADGEDSSWLSGRCLNEPDEKLLTIHEEYYDEFISEIRREDHELFAMRDELWRMSRERKQKQFGEWLGQQVVNYLNNGTGNGKAVRT